MTNHKVYLILYRSQKYIDFSSLLYLYSPDDDASRASRKSTLWRYLKRKKYKSIQIKNMKAYSLNEVLSDSFLVSKLENIISLAKALEEDD